MPVIKRLINKEGGETQSRLVCVNEPGTISKLFMQVEIKNLRSHMPLTHTHSAAVPAKSMLTSVCSGGRLSRAKGEEPGPRGGREGNMGLPWILPLARPQAQPHPPAPAVEAAVKPPSHGRGGISLPRQWDPGPSLERAESSPHEVCPAGRAVRLLKLSSEERATESPCPAPAVSTVALNFQTPGYEMDLNAGRFLINGQCGYVLKPACLRQRDTTFDPECPGPPRTTFTIQVSSLDHTLAGVPVCGVPA